MKYRSLTHIYFTRSIFESTLIHYPKYNVSLSNSLQDMKQNRWTIKYSHWPTYEGCPWIFETITILSKGLHIIQNNLHSHQAQHIWDLWLNYPIVAFNGYDPVAFWRFIPPLHRSTSHYVCVNCTVFLIYYCLNTNAKINSFASKLYLF